MKELIFTLFVILLHFGAKAQNNAGFENGHFTNWQGAHNVDSCGTSTPNPLFLNGIDSLGSPPQQAIVSIGYDHSVNLASLPVNSPFGGTYSVRLGDTLDGCGAAQLTYTFVITPTNYEIAISYATIFNDDGTIAFANQPKFIYNLQVNGCGFLIANDTITYSSADASFYNASSSISGLHYSNWKTLCVNLLPWLGVCYNVTLTVISSDGNTGLNRGYAYVDFQLGTSCSATTGMRSEKDLSKNNINIYPNPVNKRFTIDTYSDENITISIYDITGKCVLNKNIADKSTIDVSDLNEGIYTLSIKTSHAIENKKLIIIR